MTQLEKEARELVDKYDSNLWIGLYNSKQCALMEIKARRDEVDQADFFAVHFGHDYKLRLEYLSKLEKEIEKL